MLADHQRLLRDAFADAGREIDTQGDAFFVAFPRAKDAVAAALAAQRALAHQRWPHDATVRVSVGLHTGEPAATRDRYIGLGVHRAARICAAAHGGQILVSGATYAVLADDVLPDITFHDLGEHRLKDLDRSERIYQLVVPDLPRAFPQLRTLPADAPEELRLDGERSPGPATGVMKRPLRIVVADDSVLIREGLVRLLDEAGFEIAAKAADSEELLNAVGGAQIDVAITDIKMPPTHVDEGLVAATEIRRLKDRVYDIAVLGDAIRRIGEGECVVDPTIVSRLMSRARGANPIATMSAREQTILALVAEGRSDEAIRQHLDLQAHAFEAELQEVFAKLGLSGARDDVRRVVAALGYLRSTV